MSSMQGAMKNGQSVIIKPEHGLHVQRTAKLTLGRMSEITPKSKAAPQDRSNGADPDANKPAGAKTKKRTKTGCLTCRKRRIKCDEGRPTCRNCNKSRRQCEGYQPRSCQHRGTEFTPAAVPYPFPSPPGDFQQGYGIPGQFPSILPRPGHQESHPQEFGSINAVNWMPNSMMGQTADIDQNQLSQLVASQVNLANAGSAPEYLSRYSAMMGGQGDQMQYPGMMQGADILAGGGGNISNGIFSPGAQSVSDQSFVAHSMSPTVPMPAPNPVSPEGYVWNPNISGYDPNFYTSIPREHFDMTETIVEDELYDVGSEEEEGGVDALERNERTGLPLMMSVHPNFDIRSLRSHDTFLNTPNVLANYEPQWHASPLMNPTTARIFGHFIAVTACHLSLGQRRASNPSLLFQPRAVPKSQQGLWTYILPQKALTNQGLMHAMLAMASLQIAMLQNTDRHTARKHYHHAIKRNSYAVGSTKKRTAITTIATTLLLASFEVWAADHSNWNSHLVGARQLLLEADFKRMTRRIKENKLATVPSSNPDDPYALYLMQKAGPVLQAEWPDEELLEKMMGYKVPYGDLGVQTRNEASYRPLTQADIDTHDSYSDLFWYFVKQDIYYSTISSKPLMMPFERWGECPPRAPIGKLDAIYGTSDHLMLIYGRIARFLNSDLARKKKAVEANGGRWQPPPGMALGSRFGNSRGSQSTGSPGNGRAGSMGPGMPKMSPSTPEGPGFMGMIPDMPGPRAPRVFEQVVGDHIFMPAVETQPEVGDLEAAFERAMGEWNEIQAALDAFEAELQAPVWQPLPLHAAHPIATHFGSALQYTDYRIADIWSMFYTARIIMARIHPTMPPAATMAAAVCAGQTAEWAEMVGQIVFGLQTPTGDNEPLNPTFASVLTQNMYTLFFSGVQYKQPAQRLVCVQRLQYIAEKVGHETAALIAAALETCWINAHHMGGGPEWQRQLGVHVDRGEVERNHVDFRTVEKHENTTTVLLKGDDLRTQFGMGIMGLESDFQKLDVR